MYWVGQKSSFEFFQKIVWKNPTNILANPNRTNTYQYSTTIKTRKQPLYNTVETELQPRQQAVFAVFTLDSVRKSWKITY